MKACLTLTAVLSTSKILMAVVCGLLLAGPAQACSIFDAEYVPDAADHGKQNDYYDYKITAESEAVGTLFELQVIDPKTQALETRLTMPYRDSKPGEAPTLLIAKDVSVDVQLLNQKFNDVPARADAEAPAYILMHEAYAHFMNLSAADINAQYMSAKRVIPGAKVAGRLELIPDVWVLARCRTTP